MIILLLDNYITNIYIYFFNPTQMRCEPLTAMD